MRTVFDMDCRFRTFLRIVFLTALALYEGKQKTCLLSTAEMFFAVHWAGGMYFAHSINFN